MKKIGKVFLEEVVFNITPPEIDAQILCKIEWDNSQDNRPIKGVYFKVNGWKQKDINWKKIAGEHYGVIQDILHGQEHLTYFDFPVNELVEFYNKKAIDELWNIIKDLK